MQEPLFDILEYTRPDVCQIMQGKTCRTCSNMFRLTVSGNGLYCKVQKSPYTTSGHLKVKANQPACILYTKEDKP